MGANPDYKELFNIFNEEGVEYIVVGAHAVIFYAEPRYTKGLDIWVNPTKDNARNIWSALQKFGAPLQNISQKDFTNPDLVYQIGVEPNRIDILMGISGIDFHNAILNAVPSTYSGIPIKILGKADLIKTKKAIGRKQDLIDVERLENEP